MLKNILKHKDHYRNKELRRNSTTYIHISEEHCSACEKLCVICDQVYLGFWQSNSPAF